MIFGMLRRMIVVGVVIVDIVKSFNMVWPGYSVHLPRCAWSWFQVLRWNRLNVANKWGNMYGSTIGSNVFAVVDKWMKNQNIVVMKDHFKSVYVMQNTYPSCPWSPPPTPCPWLRLICGAPIGLPLFPQLPSQAPDDQSPPQLPPHPLPLSTTDPGCPPQWDTSNTGPIAALTLTATANMTTAMMN